MNEVKKKALIKMLFFKTKQPESIVLINIIKE